MMSELENRDFVDQLAHPAVALLAARPELFARQGSLSATWRRRGDKTFGPYYRLRYRDQRRACSLYLGPAGALVDRVRGALDTLQSPLRQRRAFDQLRRSVRDALRRDRRTVDAHLRRLGLWLKGFEVRGWRTSPLRTLTRWSGQAGSLIASLRIKPLQTPRVRRLRFLLKGSTQWIRQNRRKIPRSPQARLHAFLDARTKIEKGQCQPNGDEVRFVH
jgi:hypothetical protein